MYKENVIFNIVVIGIFFLIFCLSISSSSGKTCVHVESYGSSEALYAVDHLLIQFAHENKLSVELLSVRVLLYSRY